MLTKFVITLTCFAYISNVLVCSTLIFATDRSASHPDHPDLCHYKNDGHIFGVGQFYYPYGKAAGGCFAYECQAPGVIATHGCDPDEIPKDCKRLKKDLYTPFPHCCERYLCENKKGELVVINPSLKSDWAKLN